MALVRTLAANWGLTASRSASRSWVASRTAPPALRARAYRSATLGVPRAPNSSRMTGHMWVLPHPSRARRPNVAQRSCTARVPMVRAVWGAPAASREKHTMSPARIACSNWNPVASRVRPASVSTMTATRSLTSPTSPSFFEASRSSRYRVRDAATAGDTNGVTDRSVLMLRRSATSARPIFHVPPPTRATRASARSTHTRHACCSRRRERVA